MTSRRRSSATMLQSVCVAFAALTAIVTATTSPSENKSINSVIEWVEQHPKGSFNHKQIVRRADATEFHTTDEVGVGVFAAERIEAGELLATIPWDLSIAENDRDDFPKSELNCRTTFALIEEMKLGDDSKYAPFMRYLQAEDSPVTEQAIRNPSTWSDAGKRAFHAMLEGTTRYLRFPPYYPTDWLENDWEKGCGGDRTPAAELAAMIVLTRGIGEDLMPIADLYNHESDPAKVNVQIKPDNDNDAFVLVSTAAIDPGQQLVRSYIDSPLHEREEDYGMTHLLRDHGFISQYPQQWNFVYETLYDDTMAATISKRNAPIKRGQSTEHADADTASDDRRFKIKWDEKPQYIDGQYYMEIFLSSLARWKYGGLPVDTQVPIPEGTSAQSTTIPRHEHDIIMSYIDASILILANMLWSTKQGRTSDDVNAVNYNLLDCVNEVTDGCYLNQLYHTLESEEEEVPDRRATCNVRKFLNYSKFGPKKDIESEYQDIRFRKQVTDEGNINACMELDDILQICDNYRPHYHEYAVNYAARYLPEFKRVAFIGGGDSMILQEVLKYPNLELVIGLELDQVVVRNAFEWFHTDPHFHDDRVEWWFGDATKSLLLLPREYMNSFDFVMVDVSETGASLTVTEHLDILNAMALLVKPGGIMVKNEPHFEKISATFDYSVDVHYYNNPMICDQSMIMGSNHIDFYHHDKMTDHGVDNLLLPEIDDYPHQYYLWRDYKINDPTTDGSCDALAEAIEDQKKTEGIRKGKSEGMLMVIEVEHCTIPLDTIESALMTALEGLGFTSIISDDNNIDDNDDDDSDVVIMMAEGYVIARWWKGRSYVGLDIHLWGRFEKMDATRTALVKALGAGNGVAKGSVSSYRVIVSGMYGNNSWEEDTKLIGPDLTTHTRKCDKSEEDATAAAPSVTATDTTPTAAATIESLMTDDDFLATSLGAITDAMDVARSSMVIVFCGIQSSRCLSVSALEKSNSDNSSGSLTIVPVHVCPEMESLIFGDGDANNSNLADLHECRQSIEDEIKSAIREHNQPIGAVVLDAEAPYAMARIFTSFWTFRRNIFQNTVVPLYVSILPDSTTDEWRRNTLKQIRLKLDIDPLTRTEIIVQPKRAKMDAPAFEFSILTVDMNDTFPRIRRVEDTIAAKYGDTFMVKPSVLQGGTLTYLEDHEFNPTMFSQSDYDLSAGKQQLKDQVALGRQSVFQLGRSDSSHHDNSPNIASVLSTVLEGDDTDFNVESMRVYDDVGDGVVVVARCEKATVVAVWDGRDNILVNLFQCDQQRLGADYFLTSFMQAIGEDWSKELRDDMPRGTNKVINFSSGDPK